MKVSYITPTINNRKTSFTSKVVRDYPRNSASEDIKDMVDKFEEGQISSSELGHGLFASAYKIEGQPIVIKKSYDSEIAKKVNQRFETEGSALGLVPNNITNSQKLISRVETAKGNYYLLSNLVTGNRANPSTNPWTKRHYNSLMNTLFLLDKANVYHMDLNMGNCLLTKDGKVNLIDYQWAQRFKLLDENKNIDNPNFVAPSNIQMFEKASLAKYLSELAEEKGVGAARSNFKDYLKEKSNFEEKRYLLLKSAQRNTYSTDIDANSAIRYEELQSKLFKNPSDDIVDIELSKLDVEYAFRQAYYLHDENIDKQRNIIEAVPTYLYAKLAIKSYYDRISELKKSTTDSDLKEYLDFESKNAMYFQNYFSWIPDTFNWIFNLTTGKEKGSSNQMSYPKLNEFDEISSLQGLIRNPKDKKFEIANLSEINNKRSILANSLKDNRTYTQSTEKTLSLYANHMKEIVSLKNPLYNSIEQMNKELDQGNYLSAIASSLYGITAARNLHQTTKDGLRYVNLSKEENYIEKQREFSKTAELSFTEITKQLFEKIYDSSGLSNWTTENTSISHLTKLKTVYNGKNDELLKIKVREIISNTTLPEKRSALKELFNPSIANTDEFAALGKKIETHCVNKTDAKVVKSLLLEELPINQSSPVLNYLERNNKLFKQ